MQSWWPFLGDDVKSMRSTTHAQMSDAKTIDSDDVIMTINKLKIWKTAKDVLNALNLEAYLRLVDCARRKQRQIDSICCVAKVCVGFSFRRMCDEFIVFLLIRFPVFDSFVNRRNRNYVTDGIYIDMNCMRWAVWVRCISITSGIIRLTVWPCKPNI